MTTVQDLVAAANAAVPEITCREYLDLKASGTNHVLIDVREKEEWDAGHIGGAIHIPRGMLEFKIEEAVPDKNQMIIVQCKSGARAALCGEALQKLGYANVKNLQGGYEAFCAETERV